MKSNISSFFVCVYQRHFKILDSVACFLNRWKRRDMWKQVKQFRQIDQRSTNRNGHRTIKVRICFVGLSTLLTRGTKEKRMRKTIIKSNHQLTKTLDNKRRRETKNTQSCWKHDLHEMRTKKAKLSFKQNKVHAKQI